MNELPGQIGAEQQRGGRLLIAHRAAVLDLLAVVHVHQLDRAPPEHVAQVDVVGHRLHQRAEVGDSDLRMFGDYGDPRAVAGGAQPGVILVARRPVTIAVVIQVAAILVAVQLDARKAPGMQGLDPAIAQSIDGLLQAAAEIAAPAALAACQRAVRPAIGEDEARLREGHALRLVGDHQQRAGLMALVLDADLPAHRRAGLLQPAIAVVSVGDQLDQGFFDGREAARVDIDHALVHRDGGNGHAVLLAQPAWDGS